MTPEHGGEIALLGIDGSGKTTVGSALLDRLRSVGREGVRVQWQIAEHESDSRFVRTSMRDLRTVLFRSLYGGAASTTFDIHDALSLTPERFAGSAEEAALRQLVVEENDPAHLVVAGFVEVMGALTIDAHHTRALVEAGVVVVRDSYVFRNAIKPLTLAEMLVEREERSSSELEVIVHAKELIYEICATWFAPAVGVYLEVDPAVACERRIAQEGIGWAEDGALIGQAGVPSFIDLHRRISADLRAFALKNDWLIVDMNGPDQDANVRRAVEGVEARFGPEGSFASLDRSPRLD